MADLFHNFIIKASPEKVYAVFSQPEHLIKWWPLESSGNPEKDEVYRLFFGEPYDWRVRVSVANTNRHFEFKVEDADDDWNPTSFGIILDEATIGTKVHFYHINWPEDNDHYKHSNFCWALLLNGMKNYIENGVVIPFPDRA